MRHFSPTLQSLFSASLIIITGGCGGGDGAGGGGTRADSSMNDGSMMSGDSSPGSMDAMMTMPDASAGDAMMVDPDLCDPDDLRPAGCIARVDEGADPSLCDGLDNDCDDRVDEFCNCEPGAVQPCFAGAPGYRRRPTDDSTFACTDGTQTCISEGEFGGRWGACEGGITPSEEVCDGLDNDCNGCLDELPDCAPTDTCPGEGDERIPTGAPFSSVMLDGTRFYASDDVASWSWQVEGTPCDKMFAAIPGSTATATNGQLSYTVTGSDTATPSIAFTLTGDYRVTMTVTRTDGTTFECVFIIPVRAPGLRIELCWDQTGPTSGAQQVDADLHLARATTPPSTWFSRTDDCYFSNCKNGGSLDWDYPASPIANCTGPGARGGFSDSCPNPRLDIDNISESSSYVPENINLDNPEDGDQFRVMVNHYSSNRATAPLVNVYCGGALAGSYGAAPDLVEGFSRGSARNGDIWRVVDITTRVSGDSITCELSPVRPSDPSEGLYSITRGGDLSF